MDVKTQEEFKKLHERLEVLEATVFEELLQRKVPSQEEKKLGK